MAAPRFSDPITPTPIKAVEIRSFAATADPRRAEAAVAAVAERKNIRRAISLVGIAESYRNAKPPGNVRLLAVAGHGELHSLVDFNL
jgi:hypothetical protein